MPDMSNPRVTMSEVAAAAGVSRTTASHALSGTGRVSLETISRVCELAEQMGYVPNARAIALRTGRSRAIAIVSSTPVAELTGELSLDYFISSAAAVAKEALRHGYTVSLVPPMRDTGWMPHLDVDGAIMLDPLVDDPAITFLENRGIKVVSIGCQPGTRREESSWIDVDFALGTELVLDHLSRRGASSPALVVTDEPRTYTVATVAGYEKWCADTGVQPLVISLAEHDAQAGAQSATAQALGVHPEVDAIYVPFDAFAGGVLAAAKACKRTVPSDLKVVTLDGPIARNGYPTLTALDDRSTENAATAARMLIDALEDPTTRPAQVTIRPRLIVRATT